MSQADRYMIALVVGAIGTALVLLIMANGKAACGVLVNGLGQNG